MECWQTASSVLVLGILFGPFLQNKTVVACNVRRRRRAPRVFETTLKASPVISHEAPSLVPAPRHHVDADVPVKHGMVATKHFVK